MTKRLLVFLPEQQEAEDINSLMSRIAILHQMIDEFSLVFQGVGAGTEYLITKSRWKNV